MLILVPLKIIYPRWGELEMKMTNYNILTCYTIQFALYSC